MHNPTKWVFIGHNGHKNDNQWSCPKCRHMMTTATYTDPTLSGYPCTHCDYVPSKQLDLFEETDS